MAERRIGPFLIEKQIGAGGMGLVYRATFTENGQKVALKVLSPALSNDQKLLKRFEREIDILKRLRHPNIVRYFGGGRHQNQRYYAMEYMDAGSLEDVLKKKQRLTWQQVLDVARQVSKGLEHAHNAGVIHRDLKPGNLFLTKKGRLKLGDFGIARDNEATKLTAAGKTLGTYPYMAPEQIVGKPPLSGKTDLYALGIVMFELLTGRKPFDAENPGELLMQHLEILPPDVRDFAPDCPLDLQDLVDRLLAKDIEDRPYDALAVHTELGELREKTRELTKDEAAAAAASVGERMTKADIEDLTRIISPEQALEKDRQKAKQKKKKKQANVPFYETIPFLVGCLLLLIAGLTWAMWPMNEDTLFEAIKGKMASEELYVRKECRDNELAEYLERFPEGRYVTEVRGFIDDVAFDDAIKSVTQTMARIKRSGSPKDEIERVCYEAWQLDEFNDRVSALNAYHALINVFESHDADQQFVLFARWRISELESSTDQMSNTLAIINSTLRDAEDLLAAGDMVNAQQKWRGILEFYAGNKEFARQVEYAKARLDDTPPPDLDFGQSRPATAAEPATSESSNTDAAGTDADGTDAAGTDADTDADGTDADAASSAATNTAGDVE